MLWDVSFNLELVEYWEYLYLRYILIDSNLLYSVLQYLSVVKVLKTSI